MAFKIDVKDVKLGFWIGAGLFLFSLVGILFSWLKGQLEKRNGG